MERIWVSDRTLKEIAKKVTLSFKEKIELARMIDRLNVDTIELPPMENGKADSLLVKSIGSAVKNAELAVEVGLDADSIHRTALALKEAHKGRLQISVPLSTVQMEYVYHKKPKAMQEALLSALSAALETGYPVEVICDDATRSDEVFLKDTIEKCIAAGANSLTLRDSAGNMLPEEMAAFVAELAGAIPDFRKVRIGLCCSNSIYMADSCSVASLKEGVGEVKVSSLPADCASLTHLVALLEKKGDRLGVSTRVRTAEIRRVTESIARLCRQTAQPDLPGSAFVQEDHAVLTQYDSRETVLNAARGLGYELSAEDELNIWTAFQSIAQKKDEISYKELDAIIAAEAMQVPAAWKVDSFVINTGNSIAAMAHLKLRFHGELREGIAVADGAISAAIVAIGKAVGRLYELDDFQIQAITEGREAMGRTLVRLRSNGRLYSGQGISTDIVGASIMAYLNALNKIVYEEEEA